MRQVLFKLPKDVYEQVYGRLFIILYFAGVSVESRIEEPIRFVRVLLICSPMSRSWAYLDDHGNFLVVTFVVLNKHCCRKEGSKEYVLETRKRHSRPSSLTSFWAGYTALVIGGLVLALLVLSACQQKSSPLVPHRMTSSHTSIPLHRNHVTPGTYPLFVRITFTEATTYEQAIAILQAVGQSEYPWTCDDPRTPVPPLLADRHAAFAASHWLLISYPRDDSQLDQLAASPQVVSVDDYPTYMCP